MDDTSKQHVKQYDWLKPHQFKPGQTGNPNGRPKGKTLKTWVKEHFQSMTDEERAEFLNKIDPIKAWEMGEGKADTKTDVTSDGQPISFVINPDLANKNGIDSRSDNSSEG